VPVSLPAGSFVRARRAAKTAAAPAAAAPSRTARPAVAPGAPAAPAGPAPRRVVSRRDFFRGGLLASLAVFGAQFGGATLAMLWPNLKGGFGSLITLPDPLDAIKSAISSSRQPYYFGAGRFYVINYDALGGSGSSWLFQGLVG